jgi:hypothetical protein
VSPDSNMKRMFLQHDRVRFVALLARHSMLS